VNRRCIFLLGKPAEARFESGGLPELLRFFSFLQHLWRKLRTTNIIERCFVEVRRRTRPMVCFVNVGERGPDYLLHLPAIQPWLEKSHPQASYTSGLTSPRRIFSLTIRRTNSKVNYFPPSEEKR
jgi:hypothetical protein